MPVNLKVEPKAEDTPPSATSKAIEDIEHEPSTVSAPDQQPSPPGNAQVGLLDKTGMPTQQENYIVQGPFPVPANYKGPFGAVHYGCEATIATAPYENIRPFVRIEMPFMPGQQDDVYEWAYQWADARFTALVKGIKSSLKG